MTNLVKDIKNILQTARHQTYKVVNQNMVKAYWLMGQRIVEEEQQGSDKAVYGDALLKNLSKELTTEFGKGFSLANLKNFRLFYINFPEFGKSYAVRSFLSWTHYRLIMRIKDENARSFYLAECSE
jgi:hypothetical protein